MGLWDGCLLPYQSFLIFPRVSLLSSNPSASMDKLIRLVCPEAVISHLHHNKQKGACGHRCIWLQVSGHRKRHILAHSGPHCDSHTGTLTAPVYSLTFSRRPSCGLMSASPHGWVLMLCAPLVLPNTAEVPRLQLEAFPSSHMQLCLRNSWRQLETGLKS